MRDSQQDTRAGALLAQRRRPALPGARVPLDVERRHERGAHGPRHLRAELAPHLLNGSDGFVRHEPGREWTRVYLHQKEE